MSIELRGIMQHRDLGHLHVGIMVTVDGPDNYVKHDLGVDIKVNRDMILKFLSDLYDVSAVEIVWPEHITLKAGDIELKASL